MAPEQSVAPEPPVPHQDPAVLVEDLVFAWPGQKEPVLMVPRLCLPRGGSIFLSGASGSGKSTLLSLIGGILVPDQGSVSINGTRINDLPGRRRDAVRGDAVGFIFQQFNLVPYLSVLDNVLIPCRLSRVRRARALARAARPENAAREILARLDLAPDLWTRPVNRLSVGQQQRVAAARALIGSPPLVIADEPTSSLDADRRELFLSLLLRECREARSSLLFVSHDRSLARSFPLVLRMEDINTAVPR